jgi:hypothetical protein
VAPAGLEEGADSPQKTSDGPPRAALLVQQGAALAPDWIDDLVASLTPDERARVAALLRPEGQ